MNWLLTFCFLFLSLSASADMPYYPDYLKDGISSGELEGDTLKTELRRVLSLYHNPTPQESDRVSSRCEVEGCYRHDPLSYKQARQVLFGRIHLRQTPTGYEVEDVYCSRWLKESDFSSRPPGPDRIPNSQVVNAEHTWPQSKFSKSHSKAFQKSDLHALYSVYSRANSSRGNSPFGDVEQTATQMCEASRKGRSDASGRSVFEPPANHKGNVARALFYFSVRYDLSIDDEEETYLRVWNLLDPVDQKEMERNEIVFDSQLNRNPFVDIQGIADLIADF